MVFNGFLFNKGDQELQLLNILPIDLHIFKDIFI